jgi:2,3-bisphosphoglycerate-dependent phosphoglycerate mutase
VWQHLAFLLLSVTKKRKTKSFLFGIKINLLPIIVSLHFTTSMPLLAIVRHGQSVYNLENRFTGLADVDLTNHGREEARLAGEKLRQMHFPYVFVSDLKRAKETWNIIHGVTHEKDVHVAYDKALEERDYGDLQGLNKADIAEKYGADQLHKWRRSFKMAPPGGESLERCQQRVMQYYNEHILPVLKSGSNVLIVAHGNSLRALMMKLENISEEAISHVELLTGTPRLYTMDNQLHIEKAENLQ